MQLNFESEPRLVQLRKIFFTVIYLKNLNYKYKWRYHWYICTIMK
jgi:hypothetical protein